MVIVGQIEEFREPQMELPSLIDGIGDDLGLERLRPCRGRLLTYLDFNRIDAPGSYLLPIRLPPPFAEDATSLRRGRSGYGTIIPFRTELPPY